MAISSLAFANNVIVTNNSEESISYEYATFVNDKGVNTCYARFCWNSSETTRTCSEWTEVPCSTPIDVETKAVEKLEP